MLPHIHNCKTVAFLSIPSHTGAFILGHFSHSPAPPDRTAAFNLFNGAALKNAKVAVEPGFTILPFLSEILSD